jgi:ligand-binding sensor domain-containing protein/DNA-binding CsgD family transcriptional regulator
MKFISIFLFLLYASYLQAQNPIGVPKINTYTGLDYNGGTQNWDIVQDEKGILYFANNEGLLAFDGRHWNLYQLPHQTIVRSIAIADNGKIFVGAQDEIGYFFPDNNGTLRFNSLRNLIPVEERQFSDVWNIVILKDEVFFRTTSKIFHLKDDIIKVYKPTGLWEFIGKVNNKIYAQDIERGLFLFDNGAWKLTVDHPILKQDYVTSILEFSKDSIQLSTLKSGFYMLGDNFFFKRKSLFEADFVKHRIYKAIKVDDNRYAVATSSAGSYIIDKKGNIIQQFSSAEGLNKNSVRSIFLDRNKNIWLGLDDGISFVAFNNAIKYIYPDKEKQISSYATLIHHNKLYIGSSNGVYTNDLSQSNSDFSYTKQNFSEISNTSGQIWSLREINQHILIGHEDGALVVNGNTAKKIYSAPGTWLFEPISIYQPSKDIIAGTYLGLQSIEYTNNEFLNKGSIKGINEPLRFLIYDNNAIWASHPYRGIYRLKLSANKKSIIETKLYTEKNGLPSALGNYIAKIKNRIVVATKNGIYEFDDKTDQFSPSSFLSPILKNNVYHYLNEDKDGNIWFISYKKIGVVDFKNKAENQDYTIVHFPELNSKVVAGFENIYPYDNENVFVGANEGLIHINYKKYIQNIKSLDAVISLIKVSGKKDSVIYGGYFLSNNKIQSYQDKNSIVQLNHDFNSIHIKFSSTLFEQQNNIEFSYQLSGFDKTWSDWSSKSEKDYTNLPHGDYTFKVKSRNNLGNESIEATYSFSIKPAWYETFWIYIFYFLVLCGLIYLVILWQKRKHIKEQEYLKYQHQLQIEHNENEIVKLRNEKLETEVHFKNKELASTSMHLVQKNKLLAKIKEELLPLVKIEATDSHSEEFKKVIRLLNEAERGDADWEQFAIHFDHVHSNFLSKLKEKFPNLSANDLKLCAYLKMNLSTKEMAQLMSITTRAVEVSRYRLRKKLQVSSDTNLFDYLLQETNTEA